MMSNLELLQVKFKIAILERISVLLKKMTLETRSSLVLSEHVLLVCTIAFQLLQNNVLFDYINQENNYDNSRYKCFSCITGEMLATKRFNRKVKAV